MGSEKAQGDVAGAPAVVGYGEAGGLRKIREFSKRIDWLLLGWEARHGDFGGRGGEPFEAVRPSRLTHAKLPSTGAFDIRRQISAPSIYCLSISPQFPFSSSVFLTRSLYASGSWLAFVQVLLPLPPSLIVSSPFCSFCAQSLFNYSYTALTAPTVRVPFIFLRTFTAYCRHRIAAKATAFQEVNARVKHDFSCQPNFINKSPYPAFNFRTLLLVVSS